MKVFRFIALFVFYLILFSRTTDAEERFVGPDNYPSIQTALFAAGDGDTIVVADGTWAGIENTNLHFGSVSETPVNLTIRSESGDPDTCIIDGGDKYRIFNFDNTQQTGKTVIKGFTLRNGSSTGPGGGIYCKNACPTIENCKIENCSSHSDNSASGGGLYVRFDSGDTFEMKIIRCDFVANRADNGFGGGIYVRCINTSKGKKSKVTITDCRIMRNGIKYSMFSGCGIFVSGGNSLDMDLLNSVIEGNGYAKKGAGLFCENANVYINGCRFESNQATTTTFPGEGGAIFIGCNAETCNSTCIISSTEFLDNKAFNGGSLYLSDVRNRGNVRFQDDVFTGNQSHRSETLFIRNSVANFKNCFRSVRDAREQIYITGENPHVSVGEIVLLPEDPIR